MPQRKKKPLASPHDTKQRPAHAPSVYVSHLDAYSLKAIIQDELQKLSSPVTHIDPASIDLKALKKSIHQARLNWRR